LPKLGGEPWYITRISSSIDFVNYYRATPLLEGIKMYGRVFENYKNGFNNKLWQKRSEVPD
jgi:hypothetical protein